MVHEREGGIGARRRIIRLWSEVMWEGRVLMGDVMCGVHGKIVARGGRAQQRGIWAGRMPGIPRLERMRVVRPDELR